MLIGTIYLNLTLLKRAIFVLVSTKAQCYTGLTPTSSGARASLPPGLAGLPGTSNSSLLGLPLTSPDVSCSSTGIIVLFVYLILIQPNQIDYNILEAKTRHIHVILKQISFLIIKSETSCGMNLNYKYFRRGLYGPAWTG